MNWISVKDDLPPEWESVLGFMPRREIGDAELAAWVGKTTKARILKFSPHDGQLVISRRAAMAETWREARETFLANLKPLNLYHHNLQV